jgi:hypothetical protein
LFLGPTRSRKNRINKGFSRELILWWKCTNKIRYVWVYGT